MVNLQHTEPRSQHSFSLPHLGERLKTYGELVKFEHTIFALPFALSALLLATRTLPGNSWPSLETLFWVILAMVGGRTYAMGLNRLADATIDAQNPRTANRPIPQGKVQPIEAIILTGVSAGVLSFATLQLPELCHMLLPVAFVLLTLYSWMKRFSNLCHLVLGLCLGASAIGGWVAVTGTLSYGIPVLLGLAVTTWVVGFDLIYACQDVDFDRTMKLFSIPAQHGIKGALALSKVSHMLTILLLNGFGLWYSAQFEFIGFGFWLALLAVSVMLILEHRLVREDDLSRVNEAFFTMNGRISLLIFTLVLLDFLWFTLQGSSIARF